MVSVRLGSRGAHGIKPLLFLAPELKLKASICPVVKLCPLPSLPLPPRSSVFADFFFVLVFGLYLGLATALTSDIEYCLRRESAAPLAMLQVASQGLR